MAKNKHLTDSDRLQIQHGLSHRNSIKKRKTYYFHNTAHQNYRKILVETREGVNISEDELVQLDEFSAL